MARERDAGQFRLGRGCGGRAPASNRRPAAAVPIPSGAWCRPEGGAYTARRARPLRRVGELAASPSALRSRVAKRGLRPRRKRARLRSPSWLCTRQAPRGATRHADDPPTPHAYITRTADQAAQPVPSGSPNGRPSITSETTRTSSLGTLERFAPNSLIRLFTNTIGLPRSSNDAKTSNNLFPGNL
jgi:hypothetical protein